MAVERQAWGSKLQFLLTCIGFSVGLGNLWRFPRTAYENGGGAFLLPYLLCSIFLGLPCLYLELFIGQFVRIGATQAFRKYKPVFQGIGWTSTIMAAMVGIFYNMIVAICILYLKDAIFNKQSAWTSCGNEWNTKEECHLIDSTYNNTIHTLPTDEYFKYRIYQAPYHLSDDDSWQFIGSLNTELLLALGSMWLLTCVCLIKGVSWIGYISYITATVPYFIIGCLFFNSLTLDGSGDGIKEFLMPQFDALWDGKTWVAAANQLCLSLSIGYGGILALSSFNPSDHNCFKDAAIVVFADSFMSIFGGCVVYGTLGYLAKHTGVPIQVIAQSDIAFSIYPFALEKMPFGRFWAAALFFMFFLLGISSQFGLSQNVVTSITDQFPAAAKKSWLVVIAVCGGSFLIAFLTCFQNGKFFQDLLAANTGNTTVFLVVFLEILIVVHFYGLPNFMHDLREALGKAHSRLGRWFGHTGYIFALLWFIVSPTILLALIGYSAYKAIFPDRFRSPSIHLIQLIIEFGPALVIPIFFIGNVIFYYRSKLSWTEAFKVQPGHPSFKRVRNSAKIYPQDEIVIKK